jgi:hypothetical protein
MNAIAMARKLDTYGGLLQQIRNDLRLQHPDWIQANGQCPMCDCYEARLIKLLDGSITGGANENSLPAIFS